LRFFMCQVFKELNYVMWNVQQLYSIRDESKLNGDRYEYLTGEVLYKNLT
jgi:hypothetical protein